MSQQETALEEGEAPAATTTTTTSTPDDGLSQADFTGAFGSAAANQDVYNRLVKGLPKNAKGQYWDPGTLPADEEALLNQLVSDGVITLGQSPTQLNAASNAQSEGEAELQAQGAQARATGLNHMGNINDMQSAVDDAQGVLDSLGDMSTDMQMRIQLEQSQYSQIMEALSNIMKKMSDTRQAIVENMK